jgi:hypothetical protein
MLAVGISRAVELGKSTVVVQSSGNVAAAASAYAAKGGMTAVFGGLTHLAKYRREWLLNFYQVHRDWVTRDEPPFAFVIPKGQRDPHATSQLLEILDFADVEIRSTSSELEAGGRRFEKGSFVVPLNQPYGAFAKTMLEVQRYPDLRYYPGGPPIPPYDVTGHTLGYLLGVDVVQLDEPLAVATERVEHVGSAKLSMPARPPSAETRRRPVAVEAEHERDRKLPAIAGKVPLGAERRPLSRPSWRSAGDDRKHNPGRIGAAVVDLLSSYLQAWTRPDGLSGVPVAVQVRKEAGGDVDSNPVPGAEEVRGNNVLQPKGDDLAGIEELGGRLSVPVAACPLHRYHRRREIICS